MHLVTVIDLSTSAFSRLSFLYKMNSQKELPIGKRRLRTAFSDSQVAVLEKSFENSHYPDTIAKHELSKRLDLAEDRITVWFQNRRAKWRRKEMKEKQKLAKNVQQTAENGIPEMTHTAANNYFFDQNTSNYTPCYWKSCARAGEQMNY